MMLKKLYVDMLSFFFANEHQILPSILYGSGELHVGDSPVTSYMLGYKT
jgi:hypothetical protein